MENSNLVIEQAKSRFYETKRSVEVVLTEHLVKSKTLLSQVNVSLNTSSFESSIRYQGAYLQLKTKNDNADKIHGAHAITTNVSSSYPTTLNGGDNSCTFVTSEGPKLITQSVWLTRTSHVMCNLSSVKSDDEANIPQVLLSDPADLLCGKKKTSKSEDENEDKLSKILTDNSYENELNANVANNNPNPNPLSFDILSTHDFSKTDPSLQPLINKTCKSLESLTDLTRSSAAINESINGKKGPSGNRVKGLSDTINKNELVHNKVHDTFYNPTNNSFSPIKMDDLSTLEFECNSGIDFNDQSKSLTHALLHINERDKHTEVELVPKVCNTSTSKEAKKDTENIQSIQYNKSHQYTKLEGLETDLLGNFTIIKDEKLGMKMHKLSDFDRTYTKAKNLQTNSVEIQTEELPNTLNNSNKGPQLRQTVKVIYANDPNDSKSTILENSTCSIINEHDAYAKKIMTLHTDANYAKTFQTKREAKVVETTKMKQESYRKSLIQREEERFNHWRALRRPIYEKIRTNKYNSDGFASGINTTKPPKESNHIYIPPKVYYESPSNRESKSYYGYDELNEIAIPLKERLIINKAKKASDNRVKFIDAEKAEPIKVDDDKIIIKPLSNFDQWWKHNTLDSARIRNQLLI